MIRYRLEGMEDFTVEDCRDLSQQLIVEIYTFALEEQGSAEGDEPIMTSEKDLAEDLESRGRHLRRARGPGLG